MDGNSRGTDRLYRLAANAVLRKHRSPHPRHLLSSSGYGNTALPRLGFPSDFPAVPISVHCRNCRRPSRNSPSPTRSRLSLGIIGRLRFLERHGTNQVLYDVTGVGKTLMRMYSCNVRVRPE